MGLKWVYDIKCNAAVSWKSTKCKMVADSSCKSEVEGASAMTKEGVFARHVLIDMGIKLDGPSSLITDSKSGRDTIINTGVTKNTIHYEMRLQYARHQYLHNVIQVFLVTTDRCMADDKTKALQDRGKVIKCRDFQMNIDAAQSKDCG
jgi:hypothetical protein